MSKNMHEVGEICRLCHRPFTVEIIAFKKRLKSHRISVAKKKSKSSGIPLGAPRKFDYEEIKFLRKKGFSIREIAKKIGCSTKPVEDAIREMNEV